MERLQKTERSFGASNYGAAMSKNKRYLFIGMIAGIILTLAGSWGIDFLAARGMLFGNDNVTPGSKVTQKKIESIDKLIQDYYLYDVDETKLTESMYAGLVNGIDDPYSCYYTKEEYEIVNESTEGHYKGIGVVMIQSKETGAVSVAHCYEGSPAQEAGILEGDIIFKVDGTSLDGVELGDVSVMIKSNAQDTVHLTLLRNGEEIELDVAKASIEIPVVTWEMLSDQKGYISIHQFTAATAHQFQQAYQELNEQGMKSLIVDLRNNPGGLLSGVCDTLDLFMPKGLLVYTEDKYGNRAEYTSKGKTPMEVSLVVLINENSASAAEIFAGAVKDHEMGTLVGTTTFGKGIVQKIFNLTDGSVVKLTISSYFTPNGVNIHGKGIEPDVAVENVMPAEGEEAVDAQLEKAIEILN